ncbi:MAG TPA: SprT family zinc-dependent metalloprotease [Vitreimonas sp.]|nr:SprT family zinc-dependent metalloprotease [Vitreimonas sp.]
MFEYIHKTNPRSRSFRITVAPNGDVIVSTPRWYMPGSLQQFLEHSAGWVERTKAKMMSRKTHASNNQSVNIFGKAYEKKVEYSARHRVGIRIEGKSLILNPTSPQLTTWNAAAEKQLNTFLKATAEKYIIPRTHQLGEKMATTFRHITLREQKSRWGSCSSTGNLNFNWRLVHYEPPIIDYVIIHELAHRTHMNHSAAFWNLVAKYDPAHLQHRGWLKRNGMSLG